MYKILRKIVVVKNEKIRVTELVSEDGCYIVCSFSIYEFGLKYKFFTFLEDAELYFDKEMGIGHA